MSMSKTEVAAQDWAHKNPLVVYGDYRDTLSDEMAQMLVEGRFDDFSMQCMDQEFRIEDDPHLWVEWRRQCAEALGYSTWDNMPTNTQEAAREAQFIDTVDYWRTQCRNARVKVQALLRKQSGEYVYAPLLDYYDQAERHQARYIRDAFGFEDTPRNAAERLEVIYGGPECERATVIGTVDLWDLLQSRTLPKYITVGPRDTDQLFFFDSSNGCGNMGSLPITRERRFRVELRVDGVHGYGLDDTYGFVGSMWTHELKLS